MTDQESQQSREIFDTYYNYVYAIVYRTLQGTGSREDVEECVIDVFHDVLRNLDHIQNSSLKSYIGVTAHHKAINAAYRIAAHSRRTVSLEDETVCGKLASPQNIAEDAEDKELTRRLLDCIESLGEPDSAIIIENVRMYRDLDPTISAIIREEAGKYFALDCTAESAAKSIQGRASLYLSEQG